MIGSDHLETLGDVILGDVVPIEADLFLGIVGIKLVVMLHVNSVALTTLFLHSPFLFRILMLLYPIYQIQFPVKHYQRLL
ncbi:hypothetical protein DPMN_105460 [Dreissena polymorpha]|uniref:Uncharacterized protein n=1 Tax=Dreissena polymorpha TaxID=45954 RepID=A0A9D4HCF4_DREPO|nr:hypothetical protein DPMN_105460 [Dreissena polymorpha]